MGKYPVVSSEQGGGYKADGNNKLALLLWKNSLTQLQNRCFYYSYLPAVVNMGNDNKLLLFLQFKQHRCLLQCYPPARLCSPTKILH